MAFASSAASAASTAPATPTTLAAGDIASGPTVIIVIGMAGSGKSTLMARLVCHLQGKKKRVYCINLDPAVRAVNYPVNIDIRDTVNYKDIMKNFKLGPNGGIMTALNLYTTRFDQVLGLVDKRAPELDYILIDTPGQIEVFNWSASGQIVCESLSTTYPTLVCYVVDAARCVRPVTFMSNMMYCCSILYKTKLPFICAFNKIDAVRHEFLQEWLDDFQVFGEALARDESTYLASLARSMSLVLEEFYRDLNNCGVSAATGEGMEDFDRAVDIAVEEYKTQYLGYLAAQRKAMDERRERLIQERLVQFEKDLDKSKNTSDTVDTMLGDVRDSQRASAARQPAE